MAKRSTKPPAAPAAGAALPAGGPDALLKMWLTGTHTSAAAMARAVGVTRQHITRLVGGDLRLTPEMALLIGKWTGTNSLVWLARQNLRDVQQLEADAAFVARLRQVRPWQSTSLDQLRATTAQTPKKARLR